MNDELHRALVRAVVEAFLCFENSSDDEVDPDVAVRATENMSNDLLALSATDRRRLTELLTVEASDSPEPSATFIQELPTMIGLTDAAENG
jgi:hypothetical protein